MDWGRAKSVLIIAFLLLNVLLGYQLWLNVQERLQANIDLSELQPDTVRLMAEKNIEVSGSIPTETPSLKELTVKFAARPENVRRTALAKPVESRIVFTDKELQDQLGSVIPDLDRYRFDQTLQFGANGSQGANNAFVFYRMQGDYPMFDAPLTLYYSNQEITAYEQVPVKQVQFAAGDTGGQAVLPAAKVIDTLVSNNLLAGSVIKDIRLGYHGQTFNDEVPLAAPTWRVVLEDGKIFYMNAISGDVESAGDGAAGDTAGERTR